MNKQYIVVDNAEADKSVSAFTFHALPVSTRNSLDGSQTTVASLASDYGRARVAKRGKYNKLAKVNTAASLSPSLAKINSTSLRFDQQSLASYAKRVGAEPGVQLDSHTAHEVLCRVINTTEDIFSSSKIAGEYLSALSFGECEGSAIDLIKDGRIVSVLSRLNQLRYGSNG